MTTKEKYIEVLKTFDSFVTISDWATKVGKVYPDLLAKAEKEASQYNKKTTGLREIAARIGSGISSGSYEGLVIVDSSESPRVVMYITKEEYKQKNDFDLEKDIEPISRNEIIKKAEDTLKIKELYRIQEFHQIRDSFKKWFGLDFEVDHSNALLNMEKNGKHHADNLHLLLKFHNGKKSNSNWKRFNYKEQVIYIKKAIDFHKLVASKDRLDIEMNNEILLSLLDRLKKVY